MLKRIQVDCTFDKYYLSKQRKQNESFSKKILRADFSYYHLAIFKVVLPEVTRKPTFDCNRTLAISEQENSAKLHDYLK